MSSRRRAVCQKKKERGYVDRRGGLIVTCGEGRSLGEKIWAGPKVEKETRTKLSTLRLPKKKSASLIRKKEKSRSFKKQAATRWRKKRGEGESGMKDNVQGKTKGEGKSVQ